MQSSALPSASTGYYLPVMIIDRCKAKPKSKQFKKQIQKHNINGEEGGGGTSETLTEAHAMLSSAQKNLRWEIEDLPLGNETRRQDQP